MRRDLEEGRGKPRGDYAANRKLTDTRTQSMARTNRAQRLNANLPVTGRNVKKTVDGRGEGGESARRARNRPSYEFPADKKVGKKPASGDASHQHRNPRSRFNGKNISKETYDFRDINFGKLDTAQEWKDIAHNLSGGVGNAGSAAKSGFQNSVSGLKNANQWMIDNGFNKSINELFADGVVNKYQQANEAINTPSPLSFSYDPEDGIDPDWDAGNARIHFMNAIDALASGGKVASKAAANAPISSMASNPSYVYSGHAPQVIPRAHHGMSNASTAASRQSNNYIEQIAQTLSGRPSANVVTPNVADNVAFTYGKPIGPKGPRGAVRGPAVQRNIENYFNPPMF